MDIGCLKPFKNCVNKENSYEITPNSKNSHLEIGKPYNFNHVSKITIEDLQSGKMDQIPKEWLEIINLINDSE